MEDDSCTHAKIYSEPGTINGDVNTLWLNCSDYGSCEYTKVIAPELKQVDIFCDNTDACYGLEVEATYVDTMNIVCKSSEETYDNYNNYYYWWWWPDDTDGGRRRRRNRRRRMQNGGGDTRTTTTSSPYNYSWYDWNWEDWWNWDTDTDYDWYYDYYYDYDWNDWDYKSNYACDQISVDANYSTDFNIFCNGNNSCYYSNFYGDYATNVNLTAIGQESMYLSYLYAKYVNDKVDVKCWSAYNYDKTESDLNDYFGWYDYDYWSWFLSGACDYAYFYIPSPDKNNDIIKTNFICEGYGCYNLNIYSENGLSDLNILIDGCKTCSSIEECVGSWSVNCESQWGSWYYNYDTFTGTDCVYGDCDCNTDQITYQDSVSCAYKYDNSSYPTIEPTPSIHNPSTTSNGNGNGFNNHNRNGRSRGNVVMAIIIVIVVMTIIFCIILFCYHKRMTRKRHIESANVNNNNNNNIHHSPIPISDDITMAKDLAMQAIEGAETTRNNNNINATMVVDNDENVVPNDDNEQVQAQFIPPATFNNNDDIDNQNENDNVGLIN